MSFSIRKKKSLKRSIALTLTGALILPMVLSPIKANASVIEGGITTMKEVSNDTNSSKLKPINLKGGEKKVNFKLVQKEFFQASVGGSKRNYAVLEVPEEMRGLVTPNGVAKLDGSVSIRLDDLDFIKGYLTTIKKIIGTEESGNMTLLGLLKYLTDKGVGLSINYEEIAEKLDIGDNILDLGQAEFDLSQATVSEDGKYLYVDVDKNTAEIVAKSLAEFIKDIREAINAIEVVNSRPIGNNALEVIINAFLDEAKYNLNKALTGMEQTINGIGMTADVIGSLKIAGDTTVVMPTIVKDPLVHAKDANGKNLFLPENYQTLTDDKLTAKQTEYDALFTGTIENNDLLTIHGKLEDLLGKDLQELLKINAHTTINFKYNAPKYAERLSGADRYATAADVSKDRYKNSDTVILANGSNFYDIAPASTLSAALNAPLLLTQPEVLPNVTKAEINRLKAENVIVIGGQNSVSNNVADQLSGLDVSRIDGADRNATAVNIAKEVRKSGVKSNTAVVVNGDVFADGLVMASVAIKNNAPLLFTDSTNLPKTTSDAISSFNVNNVYVGGGENTISKGVLNALEVNKVTRVAGESRYETATEAAKLTNPNASHVVLTNGLDFVDALVAVPFANKIDSPLLLVTPESVPGATLNFVSKDSVKEATIVGGVKSVSESVQKTVAGILNAK